MKRLVFSLSIIILISANCSAAQLPGFMGIPWGSSWDEVNKSMLNNGFQFVAQEPIGELDIWGRSFFVII